MTKGFQREFCDELKRLVDAADAIKAAGTVESFVEDRADPDQKVRAALAKNGVLVMVAATGHSRRPGSSAAAGDLTVELTCFENPKRNRASNPDAFTLVQAAEAIKDALHGQTVMGAKVRYLEMRREDADESDYRMVMEFAAFTALDPSNAAAWGIGARTLWGEVTGSQSRRGGTAQFEPGRNGRSRFVGVHDPHWAVTLTCDVDGALDDDDLPELGGEFTWNGRTYSCTDAELVSSGDDLSTVRLSGRTT